MKLYEEQELTMQVFSEPEAIQTDVISPAVSETTLHAKLHRIVLPHCVFLY